MAEMESLEERRPPPRRVGSNGPSDGGGSDLRERLARLEESVAGIRKDIEENIARKTDVLGLKLWIVLGALGVIAAMIGIGLAAANIVVNAVRAFGGS